MQSSSTFNSDSPARQPPRGRRRRHVRDAVLGLVVAAVAFEALLGALGLAGMVLPSRALPARAPNGSFRFSGNFFEFPEFDTQVRLNAEGWHDRQRRPTPEPGVRRVAVWGDSLVEGYQVEVDELFTSLLEDELKRRGARVEVLNFGASGARAEALLPARSQQYLADRGVRELVVVLHGIMEAAHAHAGGGPGLLPPPISGAWPTTSTLHRLALQQLALDGAYLLFTSARRIATSSNRRDEPPDYFFRAREIDAPGRGAAWTRLGAMLQEVAALREKGFRVALVYAPTVAEVRAVRAGSLHTVSALGLALDYAALERQFEALASTAGLPLWPTTMALALPSGATHFDSDKHWTPEGHRRVAAALAPRIRAWLGEAFDSSLPPVSHVHPAGVRPSSDIASP